LLTYYVSDEEICAAALTLLTGDINW